MRLIHARCPLAAQIPHENGFDDTGPDRVAGGVHVQPVEPEDVTSRLAVLAEHRTSDVDVSQARIGRTDPFDLRIRS